MSRPDRHALLLAAILALLAGHVDAPGHLACRGFFVSFTSGDSTRLSVGLLAANRSVIPTGGGLIALSVPGVAAAARVGTAGPHRQRRMPFPVSVLPGLGGLAASLDQDLWRWRSRRRRWTGRTT